MQLPELKNDLILKTTFACCLFFFLSLPNTLRGGEAESVLQVEQGGIILFSIGKFGSSVKTAGICGQSGVHAHRQSVDAQTWQTASQEGSQTRPVNADGFETFANWSKISCFSRGVFSGRSIFMSKRVFQSRQGDITLEGRTRLHPASIYWNPHQFQWI